MTQTLDQKRAALAWQYATEGITQHGKEHGEKYKNLAKGAPALIMNSGLMQTLAFYNGKGKAKDQAAQQLLNHLIIGLSNRLPVPELKAGQGGMPFQQFMELLLNRDSRDYMRYTDEALELLKWIRQFVVAVEQQPQKV